MAQRNSISILGCGWLGFPLSKNLISCGYNVKGSTTSIGKLPLLSEAGIEPFLVHFPESCSIDTLDKFLKSETLIITVPPGRNIPKNESYFGLLTSLTNVLANSPVQRVIFISSTSVYGDVKKAVDERDASCPDSEAGSRLLRAEQMISAIPVKHVVIRLSGLIGPERHPGRFLAGKQNVPNGLAPVNLIHLDDAVGIIREIVNNGSSEGIYNAVAPDHPERQAFYALASSALGLEPPGFIQEKVSWKEIRSSRINHEFEYHFRVPDLMQWLAGHPGL